MEQVEKMSTTFQLIAEQHEDSEVPLIFSRSVSETQVSYNPTCYFTKNGVLMKMWRPPDVPTEEEWALHYQMIVPKTYSLLAQSEKSCGAILPVVHTC